MTAYNEDNSLRELLEHLYKIALEHTSNNVSAGEIVRDTRLSLREVKEQGNKAILNNWVIVDLVSDDGEWIIRISQSGIKKLNELENREKRKNSEIKIESKRKINPIITVLMVVWFVFGMTMGILALNGYFIPESEQPISVSKEYLVSIETLNEPGINTAKAEAITGFVTLTGDIILKSTQFSAQNPIKVDVALYPDESFEEHSDKIIETLPEPFWIFFPDAINIENKEKKNNGFAIINLTKSFDPPKIAGSGTIIFSKGGNNEVLLIEPRELGLISDLINDKFSKPVSFLYTLGSAVPKGSVMNNTVIYGNESITIEKAEFSILTSEKVRYFVEIKTADSLRSLENNKETSFGVWLAITFGPIGLAIVIILKKH